MKMEIALLNAVITLKKTSGLLEHVQWLRLFEGSYSLHIQSEVVFVAI
jgi:hypothetical protein